MKWYFKIEGRHTHVRVFMNHAKCGDLCFRNEEFQQIREQAGYFATHHGKLIEFIEEP